MKCNIIMLGAILVSLSALRAQTISVHIDDGTTYQMAPTAVAGAPGVATDNWNDLAAVAGGGDGTANGSLSGVVDNTDTATTVDIAAGGPKTYLADFPAGEWGWSGDDATMHAGGLNNDCQFTISDVAYALYDVYVYLAGGTNGGNADAEISLNGSGVDTTQYQYYGYGWAGGNAYTQITSTDPANPSNGNYVWFTGNTASSFTLSYDPNSSNPAAAPFDGGVAGIQIVDTAPVPEPATPSLAAFGLAALALAGFHSRRKLHARS
jgi:MYXO-CTERM domain-containing protein